MYFYTGLLALLVTSSDRRYFKTLVCFSSLYLMNYTVFTFAPDFGTLEELQKFYYSVIFGGCTVLNIFVYITYRRTVNITKMLPFMFLNFCLLNFYAYIIVKLNASADVSHLIMFHYNNAWLIDVLTLLTLLKANNGATNFIGDVFSKFKHFFDVFSSKISKLKRAYHFKNSESE